MLEVRSEVLSANYYLLLCLIYKSIKRSLTRVTLFEEINNSEINNVYFSKILEILQNLLAINKIPINNRSLHPSKKIVFFWSNSYRNEVIITCLVEMLELPSFGHTATSII